MGLAINVRLLDFIHFIRCGTEHGLVEINEMVSTKCRLLSGKRDTELLSVNLDVFVYGLLGGVGLGNRKGSHKALNVMRQQFINEYNNTLRGAAVEAPRPQPTSFAAAEEG
jgi:hypothetical protein